MNVPQTPDFTPRVTGRVGGGGGLGVQVEDEDPSC